ncbi:MAG: DUF2946 domain-containing protein [Pseudomonadota bacterium]
MFFYRRTRKFTAWLASFAILLTFLAPSVSQAVSATDKPLSFFAEICTAAKEVKWMEIGDSRTLPMPLPDQPNPHVEHCPLCLPDTGSTGFPPDASSLLVIPSGQALKPLLFYRSPRPLSVWASAQSRAPPLL